MCRMHPYVYFGLSEPPNTSPHAFDEVFLAAFWCTNTWVNSWEGDYRSSNFEYNGDNNVRLIDNPDFVTDVFALWYHDTTITYYSIRNGVVSSGYSVE